MTNYYIEKDNEIKLFDTDKEKLQNTLEFCPDLKGLEILETERPIVLSDDCKQFLWGDTPEQAAKELARAKAAKIEENQTAYEAALKAGVTFKDELFDCDTLAAVRVMGQMAATQAMIIEEEPAIDWFDYNYKPVALTIPEFMELAALITLNTRRIETINSSIHTAIEAAQSLEDLEAIEVSYVVPEEDEEVKDEDTPNTEDDTEAPELQEVQENGATKISKKSARKGVK